MNQAAPLALINNAALLLALFLVYEITYILPVKNDKLKQVMNGVLIAVICILIMKVPFEIQEGLMIDTRSILISISALTFGPIPTSIAVLSAIIYLLYSGGAGAFPGLLIIVTSALIGSAWRYIPYPGSPKWNWLSIYIMSLTVHVAMLFCLLVLPYPNNVVVLNDIVLSVLLIFPVVSILLSLLLLRQKEIRDYQQKLKQLEDRILCDFNKLKKNEEALISSELKYRRLFESMQEGIIIIEADTGLIIDVNPYLLQMSGYTANFFVNKEIRNLGIFYEITIGTKELINLPDEGHIRYGDVSFFTGDGSHKKAEIIASAYHVREQRMLQLNIRDVTERKKVEEKLLFLSNHDYLTGLYNRRYFENEIACRDTGDNLPLSVITCDINGLKLINEVFGEKEGDAMLFHASRVISSQIDQSAVAARTGGDEFDILLPKTEYDVALAITDKIRSACNKHNQTILNEAFHLNLSLGIATKEEQETDLLEVIKAAGDQMYQSKLLEKKSSHSAVLESIKATMLEKSHETEEHAERLVVLSGEIGRKLNLNQSDMNHLALLATLHDIGKVGISDQILNKPGKLNEAEWIEMRKHPEIGYRIAASSCDLALIAEYILCHHERWDGGGYPQRISGADIPLLSRIIAVVDAYDAMTQDRPYRKAMKKKDTLEEIERNSGTQFDPAIVDIFKEMVNLN